MADRYPRRRALECAALSQQSRRCSGGSSVGRQPDYQSAGTRRARHGIRHATRQRQCRREFFRSRRQDRRGRQCNQEPLRCNNRDVFLSFTTRLSRQRGQAYAEYLVVTAALIGILLLDDRRHRHAVHRAHLQLQVAFQRLQLHPIASLTGNGQFVMLKKIKSPLASREFLGTAVPRCTGRRWSDVPPLQVSERPRKQAQSRHGRAPRARRGRSRRAGAGRAGRHAVVEQRFRFTRNSRRSGL